MKILIACIHYPVASGRFLQRALLRLGHDVRTAGPTTGAEIWGMKVDEKYAWTPSYGHHWQMGEPFATLEQLEPLLATDGWAPDLVVTADSAYTLAGPCPCPHVVFGMDNHVRDYHLPGASFDALFLAHSWGARMGEPHAHWCPPGYDPAAHSDLGTQRQFDVLMLGYPYAERRALAAAFEASGLHTGFGMGQIWDEYNLAYASTKIALVRSVDRDLTQRFLENMAQGCCVLADRPRDAEKLGFLAGVDYWPYATAEEAVHEARWLLKTGRWRDVAANGQRKVAPHTWDARALKMLETVFAPEGVDQPDAWSHT